jgi:D-erythronate 2-dehydrogenase
MRVLITGAAGFIGRALVRRLIDSGGVDLGRTPLKLVLVDRRLDDVSRGASVEAFAGDMSDLELLRAAVGRGADYVFHLASVPGGAAEANFEEGLRVNLEATVRLLEVVRRSGSRPRLVFASTVGVYGVLMPSLIDEHTPPSPSLSYGAHKLASEILIADYSRRGWLDGVSLRLPGIVARPASPDGAMRSAFMSDLLHELAAGRPFTCPVSAEGVCWWMSRPCAVGNLLHAAAVPDESVRTGRTFLLPALRATIAEVAVAVGRIRGVDTARLLSYRDDAALRTQFADFPRLETPAAIAAGFCSDGDVETLIRRALDTSAG